MKLLGCNQRYIFTFLRNYQICSQTGHFIVYSHQQRMRSTTSFHPILSSVFYFEPFWWLWNGILLKFQFVFSFLQMTVFIYLPVSFIYSFEKFIQVSWPFKIHLFSLWIHIEFIVHSKYTPSLLKYTFWNYFL